MSAVLRAATFRAANHDYPVADRLVWTYGRVVVDTKAGTIEINEPDAAALAGPRGRSLRTFALAPGRIVVEAAALLLCALLLASPAAAQDVVVQADKTTIETLAFEPLGSDPLWPANLDGIAATREWVQYRQTWDGATEIRGIALRGSQLCQGEWFDPRRVVDAGDVVEARIITTAGVDRLVVQGHAVYAEIAIRFGCVR